MKLALVFVALFGVIHPVWLQVDPFHSNDMKTGDSSFFAQPTHSLPADGQCIGNCTSQSGSFLINTLSNPPVQHVTEAKPSGYFGFFYSAVSSLLNYLHQLFVQPWMGFVGLGQSSSARMDRNAYTVEGRSAPTSSALTSTDWHEIGTTAFNVLSSIFLKNKSRPTTIPSSSPAQSTPAPLSAIKPL
ncbi:hypothetical protein DAPPUDRAFT_243696 [Daphnia pulex]|uniref:Uncharacterized protein n=1 Tax=Daphnia pulex TaxID=6669 RepID=E9GJF0_DAPPU|nr:hypothetical protein DAPPUDRAFT_243696 [Daphnia pulex]|eukprot:EFX80444.1 hypothetical protein DAPPUDRAFT_243696 [Daphnia pulex]